jgi:VWFA-related protein
VEVPELLVPVVVRDKQGHAVGSLGKADFTVFDQGKARAITGFSVMKSALAGSTAQAADPARPAVSGDAAVLSPAPDRFIVFVFDDRHLTSSDLAITQKAATGMLDEPLAPTDHAAVLSLTGANSGITSDRAVLQSAIMKLTVHQASQHAKEDCPDVDYYSADKIINQHDPMEFQVAVLKAKACSSLKIFQPDSSGNIYSGMDNPTDPFQRMAIAAATHALAVGEEDARQTLLEIETVVRAMANLPGQRTLILVSPGFLSVSPDLMLFKSQILDQAAGANVVINALDARGLYVGNTDASQGPNATISQITGATSSDHLNGMVASENAMSELANGTGGTFFHNSNDLEGGLKSLAAPPEYLYMLGVSLKDVKANGNFHQLQVKVGEHGLHVQARRGYFAPKAPGSKR